VTSYEIKNKIHELRSYIASDWPDIEERKKIYKDIEKLEIILKDLTENEKSDCTKN
jgi:hypothetical protein